MIEKLKSLITQFKDNESFYTGTSYNEQECRLEFIDKLLEYLGWDVQNNKHLSPLKKEVQIEKYDVNMKRPDYSLTFYGHTKLFVEAKKPGVDITVEVSPSIQARKYGWNAKHSISVLTNFKDLYIYDSTKCPEDSDSVNTCLIAKYHYTEYADKYDEISKLIGRDFIYSGDFDKYCNSEKFKKERQTIKVDEKFLIDINNWRIELANDLYSKDPAKYDDLEFLNDCIQDFINKIVFLRICEDRNLKTYELLCKTIKDQTKLKTELNNLFKKSDAQYNSGLFNDSKILFDLDNFIIFDIIQKLYYPNSPYLFNIIEPNLFGEIYELFLTEKLSLNDGAIVLTKKKECENRSIVTTPLTIVKEIIKESISNKIDGLSLDDILFKKVIDIACGSGVFLEESFDALCSEALIYGIKNNKDYIEKDKNGDYKLAYKTKKLILSNCIYGVDIDAEAVDVCKLSLLIKLLEGESNISVAGENPILPDLSNNIKCGNSLVGSNIGTLDTHDLLQTNPFDWEDFDIEKFDFIVGNPPYVKTEDLHNLVPAREFAYYQEYFKTSYKQFDKYYLFIEKALSLLSNNGSFGMIVPNKFLKIDTAKELRKLLLNSTLDIKILDFGDSQLFDNKTIYSCLIYIFKNGAGNVKYRKINDIATLYVDDGTNYIGTTVSNLSDDVWAFSEKYNQTLSDSFIDLTDVYEILNGIQTSMENPHVYWIGDDQITKTENGLVYFEFKGNNYICEESILRPYFKPVTHEEKNGETFDLVATNKSIIYPYDDEGHLIPIDVMRTTYPYCFSYLSAFYDVLVPKQLSPDGKRDIPTATADTWYQYGRTQNLTAFNNARKIIVKNMFNRPMFVIDDSDMILSSGGTAGYSAIKTKTDNQLYSLEFIQAWLNADYTLDIIKDLASQFEGDFYAIGTSKLKKIRIPKFEADNGDDIRFNAKVHKAVDDIRKLKIQLKSTKRAHQVELIKKENERLIKLINDSVGEYYSKH